MNQRKNIEAFLQHVSDALVFDVRSPIEYDHAHLPGAINLPLFNNEERAFVGTTYKQQSRAAAIKEGLTIFGPKMRTMVEQVEAFQEQSGKKQIAIYCARGGMRSGAVSWLLGMYGFEITTLVGGYKAYRNWVLQQFLKNYPFILLSGNTGSGKTKILLAKQATELAIDIEGLANHKGSAFGNIGLGPQPSQEMFENKLAQALYSCSTKNPNAKIWLEDESQRLGRNIIPQGLWLQMRSAPVEMTNMPFDERLQNVIAEYGGLPKEELAQSIQNIRKRLGGADMKNALLHLEASEIEQCFSILLSYYDREYKKGFEKRTKQII